METNAARSDQAKLTAREIFDSELPRWQRDTAHLMDFKGARSGADNGAQMRYNWNEARLYNGLPLKRLQKPGGVVVKAPVPAARYERAIDNQGNLVPVVVCSNRVDEQDPRNYGDHIIKLKRGPVEAPESEFLFIDLPPYGISPDAWYERCMLLRQARQVAQATEEEVRGRVFETAQQRMEHVTRDTLKKTVEELVAMMFASMKAQQAGAVATTGQASDVPAVPPSPPAPSAPEPPAARKK